MNTSFDYSSASLLAIAAASAIVLSACGPQNGEPVANATHETEKTAAVPKARATLPLVDRASVGEVQSVEAITERPKGSGAGAVIGGVLGGVLGHQVGDGNGQKAATAAGAIGGAVLGNKVERDRQEKIVGYRVQVRLDNGDTRTFEESQSALHVGDRVRVESGRLIRV